MPQSPVKTAEVPGADCSRLVGTIAIPCAASVDRCPGPECATILVGSVIVSTNSVEEANRAAFNQQIPGIVQGEQTAGKHSLHPNDGG